MTILTITRYQYLFHNRTAQFLIHFPMLHIYLLFLHVSFHDLFSSSFIEKSRAREYATNPEH